MQVNFSSLYITDLPQGEETTLLNWWPFSQSQAIYLPRVRIRTDTQKFLIACLASTDPDC